MRLALPSIVATAALCTARTLQAQPQSCPTSVPLVVAGTSDPFLAGQPEGTAAKCCEGDCDYAPDEAPALAPIPLFGGDRLCVSQVAGSVNNVPWLPGFGPEGGATIQGSNAEHGIAGYSMPKCALLGVFLPSTANGGLPPAALDFATGASRDFAELAPSLFQPFFIGDGLRSDGATLQVFVAPPDATRLFVGVADGCGWYNNAGSFSLFVQRLPSTATPYCTAGTSSNGCAAHMSATGIASASAGSGFTLGAGGVDGQRSGIVFYGLAADAVPWASGSTSWLCVGAPRQRTGAQSSGGSSGACDGTLSIDWNAWIAANPGALGSPFAPGQVFYAQAWFRDPPAPKGTNLSDALMFTSCD